MSRKFTFLTSLLGLLSMIVIPLPASAQGSGVPGGNPDFNGTVAKEEGY